MNNYYTLNKKTDIDTLINKINYAIDVIIDYRKNGEYFDPFRILADEANRNEKIFSESVGFLHDVEEAVNNYNNALKKCL